MMNAVRSEDGAETARLEMPGSRRQASRSQDTACQHTVSTRSWEVKVVKMADGRTTFKFVR